MSRPDQYPEVKNNSRPPTDIHDRLEHAEVNTVTGETDEIWRTNSTSKYILYFILNQLYSTMLPLTPTLAVFGYLYTHTTLSTITIASLTLNAALLTIIPLSLVLYYSDKLYPIRKRINRIGYDFITYIDEDMAN